MIEKSSQFCEYMPTLRIEEIGSLQRPRMPS